MGGISNYGTCCNRIIVSRQWRNCPFCGGPLERVEDDLSTSMQRTSEPTYPELKRDHGKQAELLGLVDSDNADLRRAMSRMQEKYSILDHERNEAIREAKDLAMVLETTVEAPKSGPRAPDIVITTEDTPGVSGGLASIQEACSHVATRGVNKGKPCIRPREPDQKHATGRHRY